MIEICSFEDVLPFWRNKLWPNRISPIEPTSAMTFPEKGYDMTIMKNTPTFWRYRVGMAVVAVFSGHKLDMTYYRGRGLWVDPIQRRKGIATALLARLCEQARIEDCSMVWIIPRHAMWPVYEKAGFIRMSEPFTEGMEFGPNLNAVKGVL